MPDDAENVIDPPPDPLAEALARLQPAPVRLDRDRLMYAAGVESSRSTIRLWQLTAGFLAALGFAAGVLMYSNSVFTFDRNPPPAKTSPAAP
jgi:hypothetical protein